MLHPYACTCGGENQNCIKCDGTGTVEHRPAPPHPVGRPRPHPPGSLQTFEPPATRAPVIVPPKPAIAQRPAPRVEARPVVGVCSACKLGFADLTRLYGHLDLVHRRSKGRISLPSGEEIDGTVGGTCPECGARPKLLEKHLADVHSPEGMERRARRQAAKRERKVEKARALAESRKKAKELSRQLAKLPQTPARTEPAYEYCSVCGDRFNGFRKLQLHLNERHGFPRQQRPPRVFRMPGAKKQDQGSAVSQGGSRTAAHGNPYKQYDGERRMDATYGMGGTARDHGQFGSAASYDSMDDESSA